MNWKTRNHGLDGLAVPALGDRRFQINGRDGQCGRASCCRYELMASGGVVHVGRMMGMYHYALNTENNDLMIKTEGIN
jgi:hypothetical protein